MSKIKCDSCWEQREDQGYVLHGEKVCKECYNDWENQKGHKYPIGQSNPDGNWESTIHCSSCDTLLAYADYDADFDDVQIVCQKCYRNKWYD